MTHEREFQIFLARLRAKLAAGAATYGDASFDTPLAATVDELQAECLDLAGWGWVLWVKLEALRASLAKPGLR